MTGWNCEKTAVITTIRTSRCEYLIEAKAAGLVRVNDRYYCRVGERNADTVKIMSNLDDAMDLITEHALRVCESGGNQTHN